jgi:hypothetical protein
MREAAADLPTKNPTTAAAIVIAPIASAHLTDAGSTSRLNSSDISDPLVNIMASFPPTNPRDASKSGRGKASTRNQAKPEEHAGAAEHESEAVGGLGDPSGDVADLIGEAAGHDVISGELAGRDELGVSLDREVVGEPVGIAGDVVVDVLEAECFEPARGSWAHVSEVVGAAHDDRATAIEGSGAALVELF